MNTKKHFETFTKLALCVILSLSKDLRLKKNRYARFFDYTQNDSLNLILQRSYSFFKPIFRLAVICLFFIAINSCNKDDTVTRIDLGHDYFPVKVGSWIVYDVDSVVMDVFLDDILTFKYQIKQVVESVQQDAAGRDVYRIERYFRENETDNWQLAHVWKWYKGDNAVKTFEENVWYVKMVFPISARDTTFIGRTIVNESSWDGNAENTFPEQVYGYHNIHKELSIPNYTFDSSITVVQRHDTTAINEEYRREYYAKNIGLVQKEITILTHQDSVAQKDASGLRFKMVLNSFGND